VKALIAVLAGDGIAAKVTAEAVRVLTAVAAQFGHAFEFEPALLGGAPSTPRRGAAPATLGVGAARGCDLVGAVAAEMVAPDAKVGRNRACCSFGERSGCSPICGPWCASGAARRVADQSRAVHGVDIMVVRELTGGIYFATRRAPRPKPSMFAAIP